MDSYDISSGELPLARSAVAYKKPWKCFQTFTQLWYDVQLYQETRLHRFSVISVVSCRGVRDLLNFVPIHARLDWFSHSITMEAFTPTWYKTVKIYRIEHTSVLFKKLSYFIFMQFSAIFLQNNRLAHLSCVIWRPLLENPGSATGFFLHLVSFPNGVIYIWLWFKILFQYETTCDTAFCNNQRHHIVFILSLSLC